MSELNQRDFTLDPEDNARLANLCGPFDEHLRQIELRLGVEINHRGSIFQVIGEDTAARAAEKVLRSLYATTGDESLTGAGSTCTWPNRASTRSPRRRPKAPRR